MRSNHEILPSVKDPEKIIDGVTFGLCEMLPLWDCEHAQIVDFISQLYYFGSFTFLRHALLVF